MVRNLMEGLKAIWGPTAGDRGIGDRETATGDRESIPDPRSPIPCYLLDDHSEVSAAVHRASLGSVVVGNRTLFAVADRPQPVRRNAAAGEIVANRVGAPLAEREVVLDGADAVAVAFDRHVERRVRLQLLHGVVENLQRVG